MKYIFFQVNKEKKRINENNSKASEDLQNQGGRHKVKMWPNKINQNNIFL